MKIDRHDGTKWFSSPLRGAAGVKPNGVAGGLRAMWIGALTLLLVGVSPSFAQNNTPPSYRQTPVSQSGAATPLPGLPSPGLPSNQERLVKNEHGTHLLGRVIEQLALGEAFDAKVRQRVWVGGREVIGVGTYEQAGDGSGRFNLQVAMHDGDGKHTLQQISDGRLAWTREQIGEQITLQRVDVGRLDQWSHGSSLSSDDAVVSSTSVVGHLPPSVRVGGFAEMLETMIADYDLRVVSGRLEDQDVWIVRGSMKTDVRLRLLAGFPNNEWPELCPNEMVVAIAKSDQPESDFGHGIPVRFEFWAKAETVAPVPIDTAPTEGDSKPNSDPSPVLAPIVTPPSTRMVSLIELYSIRPISSPPIGRFRFENQDMEVNYTNETDRYLTRYGIYITERQSRMLRR